MDLRDKILRALYGSAIVSAATLSASACGDEPDSTNQGNNGWELNNSTRDMGAPEDMASDMTTTPDEGMPEDMASPPDMESGCIPPGTTPPQLPFDGWTKDANAYNNQRVVVCGDLDPSTGRCEEASALDLDERETFLREALGLRGGCSGEPEVFLQPDDFFCGPVTLRRADCCYAVEMQFSFCAVGRPFTVDGEVRLAKVTHRDGWYEALNLEGLDELPEALRQEIAAAWAESGTHEHASVASFGRFLMDLMSLGAPLDLVQATTQAIDDEIRHARDCFSVASAYAGVPLGPDTVDVRGSMDHAGDEAAILRDAILEGCIGETLAASVAAWLAPRNRYPDVRAMLEQIHEDEGDHAVLAWTFVDWMLSTRPHLLDVARQTFADVRVNLDGAWASGMDTLEREAIAHGRVRPATEEQLRLRAYKEIVEPCAQALFAQHNESDLSARAT